jgi:hypothetical protein
MIHRKILFPFFSVLYIDRYKGESLVCQKKILSRSILCVSLLSYYHKEQEEKCHFFSYTKSRINFRKYYCIKKQFGVSF